MAHWVSAWGQAHTDILGMQPAWKGRTCMLSFRSAIAGSAVRLRLSNQEGRRPMLISRATVSAGGAYIPVTFGGAAGVTIAPGEELWSDPAELNVERGARLRVRMMLESAAGSGNCIRADVHASLPGDFTAGGQFDTLAVEGGASVPAVSSVEVLAGDTAGALVCFGDSITQMGMWTGPLAEALMERRPGLALVNKGVGGNRLLHGPASPATRNYGRAGMERFGRDALGESGVRGVIIAIGTNDFGHVADPAAPDWVDAGMLADAFRDLAAQARAKGLALYAATVPPCMGCEGFGPGQEAERSAFNGWLRGEGASLFDGILDFDAVLRSDTQPDRMDMSWDSGDHLHPGALGGLRMAAEALKTIL